MKGDAWHNGKFTVVPKVSENKGLNFLDCSADEYLGHIRRGLAEKALEPDKPIAFLCNPPYRSDDDQTTRSVAYNIDNAILNLTGADAAHERYCCFLAQMKLICSAAKDSGLPGESLLLLFTKSAWLTNRAIFQDIRSHIFGSFENVAGLLVDGSQFFDVKGKWPVAFTVWRYKGEDAQLDAGRAISLLDLTWLTKEQLSQVPWSDRGQTDKICSSILEEERARLVELGKQRISVREWSGLGMTDFKRDRRKVETNQIIVGGLPLNDHRQKNKKAYGEVDGRYIGFMDDLTPCRVRNSFPDRPWFRLNTQFMDFKKNRCFSGPPTHWGYCAKTLEEAKKLFFWYALARTFIQRRYPMWVDSDDMWAPKVPDRLEKRIVQMSFAIAYAENECVETYFPANNPAKGVPELFVGNPMTPLNPESFWTTILKPYVQDQPPNSVRLLVEAVDAVYRLWRAQFSSVSELLLSSRRPYFVDERGLKKTAGLAQIKDYAAENDIASLLDALNHVQSCLRLLKDEFFDCVAGQLDYFGSEASPSEDISLPEKNAFRKSFV